MRDPREPLPFTLLVLLGFLVARFLGVALHEVGGHGLATLAVGGSFYAFYISPGEGAAFVYTPPVAYGAADWPHFAVLVSGIAAELLVGLVLLLIYPRIRGFVPRLFALLLLVVLLVQALLYMALGALPFIGGDTANAARALGAPALYVAFFVAGLAWTTLVAFVVSRRLVDLLGDALPRRPELLYLALFWFLPLLVALAAGAIGGSALGPFLLVYLAAFAGFATLCYVLAVVGVSRSPGRRTAADAVTWRGLTPLVLAAILLVPAWLGAFGPSQGTAHGLLLQDPPLEAEFQFATEMAVNVELRVSGNRSAGPALAVVFRFRGLPTSTSPLEERLWRSYDDRADFPRYVSEATFRCGTMLGLSEWRVDPGPYIGGAGDAVWSASSRRLRDLPRVIPLVPRDPTELDRAFVKQANGTYSLYVYDPYRARPPYGGFLDALNLTWTPNIQLLHAEVDGFAVADPVLDANARSLTYQNLFFETSPRWYRFDLSLFD